MITDLKPYPAYKDSGVEWLGQVPEHWEVVPLKRLAWFKSGAGFPVHHQGDASAEIPFFKVSDMNIPGNEKYLRVCANTVSMTVAQGLGATVFPAGTIVFPKVGGALLTNKRRIAANQCCIDNNMMACVARNGNRDFLFLVMSYIDLGQFAQPGPVPAISEGEVREIRVALPSAAEQTAIVRFLDWAEWRIRRVIRARKRRIKLLEEYKQALIHQAVTGRIDVRTGQPYPAYKDSGVEWLGKVPAHWEVRRLKFICRLAYGDSLATGEREGGHIPVYGSNGCIGYHSFANTEAPCIVIGRKGSFGRVNFCLTRVFAIDTTFYIDSRATDSNLRWLYFLLGWIGLDEVSRDSAVPGLNREEAYKKSAPLPPLPEQPAIVEYLDAQTVRIDAAMAATRRQIELLREYRTRLIADVVTGKMDVREVAARLPEELSEEEAESMDAGGIVEDEATDDDTAAETLSEEEAEP
jgi:type I restriction enzyme S subunit